MSSWKILSALTLLSPVVSYACSGTWTNTSAANNWGTTGDWMIVGGCTYPGQTATGIDIATFPNPPSTPATVTLNVNPVTINQLTFNTTSSGYTITPAASQVLTFDGTAPILDDMAGSQTITAGIVLNTDTLTITIDSAGDTLTLAGAVTDAGTSSISVGNGTSPNLGILNNANNSITTNSNFSFNTGASDTGTFINNNSSSVGSGDTGTLISLTTGNFTMNAGTFQNNNSGDVTYAGTGPGTQSVGSEIFITIGDFTFNGGVIENNNLSGTIVSTPASSEPPGAIGSQIFVDDGDFLMTGGTLQSINQAPLTSSSNVGGSSIFVGGNVEITGGTVNIGNTAVVTDTAPAGADQVIGSVLNTKEGTFFTIGGGAVLNFNNSGSITNTVGVSCTSQNLNTISGTLTLTNSAPILTTSTSHQASFGAYVILAEGITLNAGGSITLLNTGDVTSMTTISLDEATFGVILIGGAFYDQTGGSFSSINSGTVTTSIPFAATGSGMVSAGPYTISGGTFLNDGQLEGASMTIAPGATVSGNGLFLAVSTDFPMTNNGGTVVAGDPNMPNPGTMTLTGPTMGTTGTYIQNSGTFVTSIINTSAFGKMVASNAHLNGGAVEVVALPGFSANIGDEFNIIHTTDAVTGTFAQILSSGLPPGFIPQLRYTAEDVFLFFLSQGVTSCPTLSSFMGAFPGTIFSSVTNTNLRIKRELQQLQARLHYQCPAPKKQGRKQDVYTSSLSQKPMEISSLTSQVAPDNSLGFVDYKGSQRRAEMEQAAAECEENRRPWNFYLGPRGSVGDAKTKGNQVGYDSWSAGGLAGFDYAFTDVGLGVLSYYERVHGDVDKHWGNFDIDQAHASIYATYTPAALPELAFDGIAGGGYEWYHFKRHTTEGTAKAAPHGAEFDALLGVEYTIENRKFSGLPSGLQIIPMALLQYAYLNVNKYTEHGAALQDFVISKQHAKTLSSIIGTWVNYTWDWTNFAFTLQTDIAWQREYFNKGRTIRYGLVDSSAFGTLCPQFTSASGKSTTASLKLPNGARNTLLAGVDFLFTLFQRYEVEASYDFQWNSQFHDQYFYVGFNARF
jgi:hypothetical protein